MEITLFFGIISEKIDLFIEHQSIVAILLEKGLLIRLKKVESGAWSFFLLITYIMHSKYVKTSLPLGLKNHDMHAIS